LREQKQSVFNDLTRRDLKLKPPPELKGTEPERLAWRQDHRGGNHRRQGEKKILQGDELNRWKYQRYLQDYLAACRAWTTTWAALLDWLDAHGLRDNTLVIYTSDQGFFLGDHGLYDKRFFLRGIPAHALPGRWPGVIQPGSVTRALAIIAISRPRSSTSPGPRCPPNAGPQLAPLFGANARRLADKFYYRYYTIPGHHNTRAHYAVRTGPPTKSSITGRRTNGNVSTFVQDPHELKNIYQDPAAQPKVAELKQELAPPEA